MSVLVNSGLLKETDAQKIAARKAKLSEAASKGVSAMLSSYRFCAGLAERDSDGISAAEFIASMSDAEKQELIMIRAVIKGALNALQPGTITDAAPAATVTFPE